MANLTLEELWSSLENSLPNLEEELDESPPENLETCLHNALFESITVIPLPPRIGESRDGLEAIYLTEGADKPVSIKASNISLDILKWLDIAWKSAGTTAAIPMFGAWAAIGFLLVLRDLRKLFAVKLRLGSGEIIHTLVGFPNARSDGVTISELISKMTRNYEHNYDKAEIISLINDLDRIRCVRYIEEEERVFLVEKVVV